VVSSRQKIPVSGPSWLGLSPNLLCFLRSLGSFSLRVTWCSCLIILSAAFQSPKSHTFRRASVCLPPPESQVFLPLLPPDFPRSFFPGYTVVFICFFFPKLQFPCIIQVPFLSTPLLFPPPFACFFFFPRMLWMRSSTKIFHLLTLRNHGTEFPDLSVTDLLLSTWNLNFSPLWTLISSPPSPPNPFFGIVICGQRCAS